MEFLCALSIHVATDFFLTAGYTWDTDGTGGVGVTVYVDVIMALNFLVDFLLLLGTNRIAGYPPGTGRAALAAAVGGIYGGACLLPGFRFLGNTFWRIVSLGVMGGVAFGFNWGALRRCVLFVLLSMALGGIATGLGHGGMIPLLLAAAGLCVLCSVGFQGKLGTSYLPVELSHGGKMVCVMALHDTGNTLRDPLTGEAVLVVGAEPAEILLGLSRKELQSPVETMASGKVPGLRLIPYRAVGQSVGMLVALRLDHVKIGGKQSRSLVAFAAEGLSMNGEYQALAGGVV